MPREEKTIKELEELIRQRVGDIGKYRAKVFPREGGDWIAISVSDPWIEHRLDDIRRIIDELRQQFSVDGSESVEGSEKFNE